MITARRFVAYCLWLIFGSRLLAVSYSQPRLRLTHKELWELNRTTVFYGPRGFLDLKTMLLDEYQERLFVGGRDVMYSLNLEKINDEYKEVYWPSTTEQIQQCHMKGKNTNECANFIRLLQQHNRTHMLACGTGAFSPVCAFVRVGHWRQDRLFDLETGSFESGRGKCPFDPNISTVSVTNRGDLFVGLYTDYWGNDAAIYRMGNLTYTRTEWDNKHQLKEPKFVGSYVIPDNDDHNDDKVYFFFTEKATEEDSGIRVSYTRIARVCANDVGGRRVLVNKWTSFLKTQLICSVPGPNGIDTYFDELEDVFLLQTQDNRNPEIIALFSTTSNVFKGYAVCIYHMAAIREAFNGPYAHKEGPEYHWTPYEGKIPFPRPGTCASKMNGGQYSSSKDYPDDVVRFVRSHPLMYQSIFPTHKKPVLLKTDGKYNLKQIVADRVEAEDGQYNVLFLGTDNGIVLKVITIYNQESETMEEVILEELHIFKVPVPILSMEISVKRQQLYIGSESAVAQVKLHQCDMYGTACSDCCLARDPYCAWDGVSCSRYFPAGTLTKRRFRRQDIRHGNAVQQCHGQQVNEVTEKAEGKIIYGIENNSTLLDCIPRSLQAKVLWFTQSNHDERKEEVKPDERVLKTDHGLLFLKLQKSDAGTYICQTVEHGFVHTVTKITLEILEVERIGEMFQKDDEEEMHHKVPCFAPSGLPQGSSKLWYKDFLQLIGYNNFQRVEEYCERVWCTDKKRKKHRPLPPKWKYPHLPERRIKLKGEHHRLPRDVTDS
ncbi:semaphorin-3E [Polypterus senegalus]|uniref:semaphorin-3E n=1 Tax=Polypterus senegalus TaxID=55291 RepID=UPI001964858E|nr:semaphorin-3E [Polypterus senegalus]